MDSTRQGPWPYDQSDVSGSRQSKRDGDLDRGVSSQRRYGAMTISDICALPVRDLTATDAHLYLWTTNSFMVEAHSIARAWGFIPKTICTWVKTKQDGSPSMKTGYYFRGATEHFLFCVRGSLRLSELEQGLPTAYFWQRLPHSVKPDEFYQLVERASPSPYLELFAREYTPLFPKRAGWDVWGNEVSKDVEMEAVA